MISQNEMLGIVATEAAEAIAGSAPLGGSASKQPTDTDRLNWLEATKTGINYNVECCAWGVDFEAPYKQTMREAIDVAMTQNDQAQALRPEH